MEYGKTKVSDGPSKRVAEIPQIRKPSAASFLADALVLCGNGQTGVSESDALERVRGLFFGAYTVKFQHEHRDELANCKGEEVPAAIASIQKKALTWVYVAKPRSAVSKPRKPPKTSKVVFSAAPTKDELAAIIAAAQAKMKEAAK